VRQVTFRRGGASYSHMYRSAPIRFTTAASLALSASLLAQTPPIPHANSAASPQQSTLPATSPTTTPAPPPIPLTPAQLPPKRAKITFADGVLSISADNASLNQILRQIATDTGMKITGGVSDERVFGEYGPAPPDQVLSALLDGTGSNMVLVHRDGDTPAELILTARQGGPTPPSPNSAVFNDRSEPRETPSVQVAQPAPELPGPANQVNPPTSTGASTGTPPTDSSQPESPNGVKTPQQIYEQLQRMRQQQQQQQSPPQSQPQPQTTPQ
jgi:hypothetical protein